MRHLLTIATLLLLAACSSSGRSESTHAVIDPQGDGSASTIAVGDIEIQTQGGRVTISRGIGIQPNPAKTEAASQAGPEGASASSGEGQELPVSIGPTFWMGLVLIIGGMALWLTKRAGIAATIATGPTGWMMRAAAVAPKGMGLGLMVAGGALIVLPWFLGQIPSWMVPTAVAAVVGIYLLKYAMNVQKEAKKPDFGGAHAAQ